MRFIINLYFKLNNTSLCERSCVCDVGNCKPMPIQMPHTQAYGYFVKYYTDMFNNLSPILLNVKFDVAKVVAIFQTTKPLPTFNTYLNPLE